MRSTLKFVTGSLVGLTGLVALVAGVSSLPGCSPGKELPTHVPAATEAEREAPAPAVPATSDPAARAVVDRSIRVMTDGHPERIDKTKVSRSTARGHMLKPVGGQFVFVETNRLFQAVYPDRVRVDYEFRSEGLRTNTIGLRRPVVWVRDGGADFPLPDARRFEEIVAIDAVGTHWLLTLTPLAGPNTTVFGLGTAPAGGRQFDTVKASIPGCPVFTLWFDQPTGHLARVEYANRQANVLISKSVAVAEYKPFAGFLLPTKIDYAQNGQTAEQWTVDSWEFPDRIDDAVFEQPK